MWQTYGPSLSLPLRGAVLHIHYSPLVVGLSPICKYTDSELPFDPTADRLVWTTGHAVTTPGRFPSQPSVTAATHFRIQSFLRINYFCNLNCNLIINSPNEIRNRLTCLLCFACVCFRLLYKSHFCESPPQGKTICQVSCW